MRSGQQFSGRRALAGSLTGFLGNLAGLGVGLAAAVYIPRVLGPLDYGIWALVTAVILWPEIILSAIFVLPSIKLVSQAADPPAVQAAILRNSLSLSLLVALGFVFLAFPLSRLLGRPQIAPYLLVYALHIPLRNLTAIHSSLAMAQGRYALYGTSGLVHWSLYFLLALLLLEAGLGLWGVLSAGLASMASVVVFFRLWVRPPLHHRRAPSAGLLWRRVSPVSLAAVCIRIFLRSGPILLGLLGAATIEIGHYGACLNILVMTSIMAATVGNIVLSSLAGSQQNGSLERVVDFAYSALRSGWWLLPPAAAAASTSEELAVLVFGPAFTGAGALLGPILMVCVARYQFSLAHAVIAGLKRGREVSLVTWLVFPSALAAYCLGLTPGGARGLALVTAVSAWITAGILYFFAWQALNRGAGWATMARCLLSAALVYLAGSYWSTSGILALVKVAALAAASLVSLLAMGEFNATERAFLRSLIQRRPGDKALEAI